MKTFLSITIGLVIGALAGSGTLFSASEPETKVTSSQGKDHVMAQPVVHFEIGAKDRAKSQAFYSKMFDWQFQEPPGMEYAMVGPAGEASIGGGIGNAPHGGAPYATFYVQVSDINAYLKKAESMGGKTVLPLTPIPGVGECGMFADPDGVVIGLFKPNV